MRQGLRSRQGRNNPPTGIEEMNCKMDFTARAAAGQIVAHRPEWSKLYERRDGILAIAFPIGPDIIHFGRATAVLRASGSLRTGLSPLWVWTRRRRSAATHWPRSATRLSMSPELTPAAKRLAMNVIEQLAELGVVVELDRGGRALFRSKGIAQAPAWRTIEIHVDLVEAFLKLKGEQHDVH